MIGPECMLPLGLPEQGHNACCSTIGILLWQQLNTKHAASQWAGLMGCGRQPGPERHSVEVMYFL